MFVVGFLRVNRSVGKYFDDLGTSMGYVAVIVFPGEELENLC